MSEFTQDGYIVETGKLYIDDDGDIVWFYPTDGAWNVAWNTRTIGMTIDRAEVIDFTTLKELIVDEDGHRVPVDLKRDPDAKYQIGKLYKFYDRGHEDHFIIYKLQDFNFSRAERQFKSNGCWWDCIEEIRKGDLGVILE